MSIVFIISAPSGSGKSTLVKRLIDREDNLEFSTSVTTRNPRPGDVDGETYKFVSKEEFLQMRSDGEFLEWAEVFGEFYGTPRGGLDLALQRGHDLILDIDVQGAALLKEKLPEAITVFILPPSKEELEARLRNRSSDPDEVIGRRLREATHEVSNYGLYDYVLVNDQLEESFQTLRGILEAERCRECRVGPRIQLILESFGVNVGE